MASLQREPTGTFHVVFRVHGTRFKRSLETKIESVAISRREEIDETLSLLKRKRLSIPEHVAVADFVLASGRVDQILVKDSKPVPKDLKPVVESSTGFTLQRLFDEFFLSIPDENLESNTLRTMRTHQKHILRLLKPDFPAEKLRGNDLQAYVNARAKEPTQYFKNRGSDSEPAVKRTVSAYTIRKELVTLGTVWRWAATIPHVIGTYPNRGLRYPKSDEKQPFRTIDEIVYENESSAHSIAEAESLWESVYLRQNEIVELLDHVKFRTELPSFVLPMLMTAAHTGARRSELLRCQKGDVDLSNGTITLREKKRVHGKRSTRRVPLSSALKSSLKQWLNNHPGGSVLFCQPDEMNSRTSLAVSPDQAHSIFHQATKGSRWEKLSGWHCLRHSFISNLACRGIDQRIIDDFVGHTTEEMRRRYRHLFPDIKNAAISAVFG